MDASEGSWLAVLERAGELEPDPELVGLDDAELEQQVRDAAAQIAAATCRYLLLVAELVVRGVWADQHAATPGEWLSWACGTAASTAREHVRVGLALRDAPLIRGRFAAGTISYSKVRAITRVTAPEVESELLALADSAPAAQLDRIVAECRRSLTAEQRWARGPTDPDPDVRDFTIREIDPDAVEIRIRLAPDEAAAFCERVDRLVDLADRAAAPDATAEDGAIGDGAVEHEPADAGVDLSDVPIGARRAAAAVEALATAVAAGPADRSGADGHMVGLHVDVADLARAVATEPDTTADGGAAAGAATPDTAVDETSDAPAGAALADRGSRRRVVTGRGRAMAVPAAVLAHLTCDAQVRIAGVHQRDGAGHPADIGRRSRTVPTPLRRALQLRDRTCRFPGCQRARHLHAHHVVHWAHGGPTDLDNLVLLCGFHHRTIHRHHWRLEPVQPLAGRWTYHAPGHDQPHPAAPPLPGAPAGACADRLPTPHPQALQPPWWDGGPWDLDETVRVVTSYLHDLAPLPVDRPPHPALPERYGTSVAA